MKMDSFFSSFWYRTEQGSSTQILSPIIVKFTYEPDQVQSWFLRSDFELRLFSSLKKKCLSVLEPAALLLLVGSEPDLRLVVNKLKLHRA